MRHLPAAMLHGGGGVLLMMTTKFASQQTIKISQNYKTNAIKAPSFTTTSNSKQLHNITSKNKPSQQTPCSSKQTYRRDPVFSNEKDAPKMTTAHCNRPRRWSCLQCVRDGERTNDHEKTPGHPTKQSKKQQ